MLLSDSVAFRFLPTVVQSRFGHAHCLVLIAAVGFRLDGGTVTQHAIISGDVAPDKLRLLLLRMDWWIRNK